MSAPLVFRIPRAASLGEAVGRTRRFLGDIVPDDSDGWPGAAREARIRAVLTTCLCEHMSAGERLVLQALLVLSQADRATPGEPSSHAVAYAVETLRAAAEDLAAEGEATLPDLLRRGL